LGKKGKITNKIIAKLRKEFHSFLLIFEANFLLRFLLDKIKIKIIEKATIIEIGITLITIKKPIKYANKAEISVVSPVVLALRAVMK
jgi:hypothetical protein